MNGFGNRRLSWTAGVLLSLCGAALAGDEAPTPAPTPEAKPKTPEATPGPEDRKAKREARKKAREAKQAERQKNRRQLDDDSPEAFALEKKLTVPSRLATDGTVKLTYAFTDPTQAADFQRAGFEAETRAGPAWRKHRWKGKTPRFLALSVSSRKRGYLRHKLDMADEFEVTFRLRVDRMTKRSDLVFFVGKSGVRFGDQVVAARGASFRAVDRARPDVTPFEKGLVTVRLKVADGALTAYVNGKQTANEPKKLRGKLDGRIGLFATDMNLVLFGVEVTGKVNKAKL